MIVHEFVEGNKPVMVLVHGLLTPWQIWTPQIASFREQYDIYAVALDAHTEEAASEFVSVGAEAEKIVQYLEGKGIRCIEALCGISLGGKIAYEVWKSGRLKIHALILDGAPLVACPKLAVGIMLRNYQGIVRRTKARDPKVIENFKKYFLPGQYLDSYLKIADLMSEESIEHLVTSVFAGGDMEEGNTETGILFIHGTKGNEMLSKKAAKLVKRHHPRTEIVCFRGDAHCFKAIYQPEQWISVVRDFLGKT